jgi:hypothetical protein
MAVVVTAISLKILLVCGVTLCRLASRIGRFENVAVEEDCLVQKMKVRRYFAMSGSIYRSIRRNNTEDL